MKKFSYSNVMTIPKLSKVVINMGIAEVTKDKNAIQDHVQELAMLSGQKPIVVKARKSVASFKLREGQPVGLKVTLRGTRMYEFIDRLCNITLPRVRDFRGLRRTLDGRGSYTFGLEDQNAFAEINLDRVKRAQGMDITFVTTAESDDEGRELLALLGIPFKK